jgi:hypothetical protein
MFPSAFKPGLHVACPGFRALTFHADKIMEVASGLVVGLGLVLLA